MKILTRLFAASLAVSLAAGGVALVAPAAHAESVTVDDIEFAWGLNNESTGGAYFGGCNFLSAGIAGDTGSARLWSEADGFFQSSAGNTSIVKPSATGGTVESTWATKCQTAAGASVNGKVTNAADSYTQSQVRIAGGTGTLDPDSDSASLAWDGAFTVAYYGGMTYWSASNPVLTVSGGTGTLTADLTGFTADMDDPSVWRTIDPTAGVGVTLATFTGVDVTTSGIVADPDFLGLTIPDSVSGRNPQAVKTGDNSAWWGAFPAQFLEYQMLTGQSSYWYTTDGGSTSIQPRKVAATFRATTPVTAPTLSPTTAAVGTTVAITASALPADAAVTGTLGDTTLFSSSTDAAGSLDTTFTVPEVAVGAHEITITVSDPATDPPVISTYSATLTVAAAPSAPSRPTISGISAGSATAKWRVPSDSGGIPVTEYTVTVKAAGSSGETTYKVSGSGAEATTESVELDDLKADTTYTVGVTATNPIGTSPASSTRTFTTKTATSTTPTDKPTDDGAAISDATLRWALNAESGSGAYFGGCNFLSAGLAGDTGSARVWTAADKLYSASSGAVRIEKPDAGGTYRLATWADKCKDRNGDAVSSASVTQSSETQVVISGGTGGTAEDGTVTVEWEGDFTVAFYGGMTYWSASDPVLTIDPDGTGTLTATASGFGADMDDATKWSTLKSRTITLADLSDLDLDAATRDGGFTVTPDYLGVAISSSGGRNNQADKSDANAAYWGSFPASFVDFQIETGQSSYWYTSNGQRDKAKPAAPLTVAYTEDFQVPDPTPPVSTTPATPPGGGTGTDPGGVGTTTGTSTGTANAGTTGSAAAAAAAADPVTDQNDGTMFQAAASDQQAAATAAPLRDTAAAVALGAGAVAAALGLSITAGFLIRRLLGLSPSAYL